MRRVARRISARRSHDDMRVWKLAYAKMRYRSIVAIKSSIGPSGHKEDFVGTEFFDVLDVFFYLIERTDKDRPIGAERLWRD